MKKLVFLLIAIFLCSSSIFAQDYKIKYGKISDEELQMEYYEKDSSANALILYDYGYSYFNFGSMLSLNFNRHIRIKILNNEGMDYANFEIPLFVLGSAKENLFGIKAKIFNLENGDVTETKLEKGNVFREETNRNIETVKVVFPGVKGGSVIDFEYSISSDFLFSPENWKFQKKIPVLYSEYTVEMPEYVEYHQNIKGFDNVYVSEKREYRYDRGIKSNLTTWIAKDVPAFIEEPYLTTYNDYVCSIDFELDNIQVPGRLHDYYSTTWSHVDQRLAKSEYFGKQLTVNTLIQNLSDQLTKDIEHKYDKLLEIYTYVQKTYKWNNYESKHAYRSLRELQKELKGNSADINFLLLKLLRAQKITANPVILSTRENGMIFPTHPTYSDYNYLIVEAIIDDKTYYLDATSDLLPAGLLPERCLNGSGRRIISEVSEEIKIEAQSKYFESSMYMLEIIPDEGLKGSVSNVYKGYAAFNYREKVFNSGSVDDYKKKLIEKSSVELIEELNIHDPDNIYKPVKETYNYSTSDNITFAGDMIYLTPLLNKRTKENPFKLEERKYPVNYAYKRSEKIIMQYTIPEGYEILEVPENINMALPAKAASFQFQISAVGNMVQVISNFKINKTVFQYDLYPALKNFYNILIEKQNQKIVLKKKA